MKIDGGVITPETPYGVVRYGWEVYRRTQQIPFPMTGGGAVLKAQSRLFGMVATYACHGIPDGEELDLALIRGTTLILIEAVRRYCGTAYGEFASGQDGSVAA